MANEGPRPDETLSASVGERLHTKDRLDADADAEHRADDVQRKRTERRKLDEREEVARHLAATGVTRSGWSRRRAEADRHGREEAALRDWGGRGLPIAGIALALLGVATGRRVLLALALPLLAGVLLLRNRLPAR